ncbi:MAG: nitroreductase [Acidimicrobiia bacterium]|nr:nitroreductase [Acidimicrobiia bacterium]
MGPMDLDTFASLVRARRTSLKVDPERPVPPELVERLCRLATWAPNHHRTWPWRFAALTGDARARLGALIGDYQEAAGDPPARAEKSRAKYLRAPLMLVVACSPDPQPRRAVEDRDAVAAGIQNLLLGATAAGLASYWGTGLVVDVPGVRELCGFAPTDVILAAIYVGWPLGEPPEAPPRPEPRLHHVP